MSPSPNPNPKRDDIRERLRRLALYGLLARVDEFLDEPWLARLLEIEEAERQRRSLERRLKNAHIGAFKPDFVAKLLRQICSPDLRVFPPPLTIFGVEVHKHLLIELLNALLERDYDHRIVDLKYLSPELHIPVEELKLSVVDVKCFDPTGRHYVVEMQVLNVEGFEKRVVYNTSKAYVAQLHSGDHSKVDAATASLPRFRLGI